MLCWSTPVAFPSLSPPTPLLLSQREDIVRLSMITKFLLAIVVCASALLLPYRARVWYGQVVAWLVHAPIIVFGRLARLLLDRLGVANSYLEYRER